MRGNGSFNGCRPCKGRGNKQFTKPLSVIKNARFALHGDVIITTEGQELRPLGHSTDGKVIHKFCPSTKAQ